MNIIDAVIENKVDRIRYLLARGVDPNGCEDDANVSLLDFAAQHGSLEAAQLLITAGADPGHQTEDGETPLDTARLCKHEDMINLLTKLTHSPLT